MKSQYITLNQWVIDTTSGDAFYLQHFDAASNSNQIETRLDPKSLQVLETLYQANGELVSKDALVACVWPNAVVTDDALARTISRIRKALQDDAKSPLIIETVPKRGYKLIAQTATHSTDTTTHTKIVRKRTLNNPIGIAISIASILLVSLFAVFTLYDPASEPIEKEHNLIQQADDYYMQMRRTDNEMAISLYEQAIAIRPSSGQGQAGLANALVQQVIRWPNPANLPEIPHKNLGQAIQDGRTQTPQAQQKLARALALAQQAVELTNGNARAYKALGFVYSAQSRFEEAIASYQKAVAVDPNAWDALINIADVIDISQIEGDALYYYKAAFDAMTRVFDEQSVRVQPWYADLGAIIGDKYFESEQAQEAETWYRHVLSFAPFNSIATRGLAQVLIDSGDPNGAVRLCEEFKQRVGTQPCSGLL